MAASNAPAFVKIYCTLMALFTGFGLLLAAFDAAASHCVTRSVED